MLTETDDIFSETRGYLLCDIYIMDKDSSKIVPEHRDNINEIEKCIQKYMMVMTDVISGFHSLLY